MSLTTILLLVGVMMLPTFVLGFVEGVIESRRARRQGRR